MDVLVYIQNQYRMAKKMKHYIQCSINYSYFATMYMKLFPEYKDNKVNAVLFVRNLNQGVIN